MSKPDHELNGLSTEAHTSIALDDAAAFSVFDLTTICVPVKFVCFGSLQ